MQPPREIRMVALLKITHAYARNLPTYRKNGSLWSLAAPSGQVKNCLLQLRHLNTMTTIPKRNAPTPLRELYTTAAYASSTFHGEAASRQCGKYRRACYIPAKLSVKPDIFFFFFAMKNVTLLCHRCRNRRSIEYMFGGKKKDISLFCNPALIFILLLSSLRICTLGNIWQDGL